MSTESTVAGVVVGAVVGVAATLITNHLVKAKEIKDAEAEELARREELHEAKLAGYNEGWRDFGNSPTHVRGAYVKHFETADEEAGTTLKR